MRIRLFTPDEANRLIERIRPELERLVDLQREFARLETRVGVLQMATAGATADNADALELQSCSERRRRLGESIGEGLRRLQEAGVLVKDLEQGLCDFYSLAGDRLVFLCWRLGEPGVAHWHTLDGGFASRRPLKNAGKE